MRIVTDCSADLTPEETRRLSITVAPLYIQFPDGEVEATAIAPDEFYTRLQAMQPRLPTTAQPAPGVFARLYREAAGSGQEILSIHISSGLSGTGQSARLGAQQVAPARVTVHDSLTLSGGLRFQVLAAAQAAEAGWEMPKILERLDQIQKAAQVAFTLETLDYLARGGRIGRVQALAGSLLKLKPVIGVDHTDGKYNTLGKARTLQHTMLQIEQHLLSKFGPSTPLWVTVLHGQMPDRANQLADQLRGALNVARLETLRISPVLGVHTGPGVVGAAVMPIALAEV